MSARSLPLTALVALALTACGRTEVAAQPPALIAQATPSPYSFNFTEPDAFPSVCNGELVTGFTTFVGGGQVVTDGAGGTHVVFKYTMTGTYTGQTTGMTYTQSNIGRGTVNVPSSGSVFQKIIVNGRVTASDGSTILIKWRIAFVVDAHGDIRVDRDNVGRDESNPPIARCTKS